MLIGEADWLEDQLAMLPNNAFPLLNVGSSTGTFRQLEQPWIESRVLAPLSSRGQRIVNLDIKQAPGVDIVSDFLTATGYEEIAATGVRSVLCSNLLEHLQVPPQSAISSLCLLVQPGGHLLVTVPQVYPHHPDPIDNGFRPTPDQLSALLPAGFEVVDSASVRCHRLAWYFSDYGRGKARFAARMALPFVRATEWRHLARDSGKHATQACVHAVRRKG